MEHTAGQTTGKEHSAGVIYALGDWTEGKNVTTAEDLFSLLEDEHWRPISAAFLLPRIVL